MLHLYDLLLPEVRLNHDPCPDYRIHLLLSPRSETSKVMIKLLLQFSRIHALPPRLVVIAIKVPRVGRAGEMRLNRRRDLAVVELLPFNMREPGVRLDVLCAAGHVAQTV